MHTMRTIKPKSDLDQKQNFRTAFNAFDDRQIATGKIAADKTCRFVNIMVCKVSALALSKCALIQCSWSGQATTMFVF